MDFTSALFWLLVILVFIACLFLNKKNKTLLLALFSLVFYGSLNWRFLIPLFISLTTDYSISHLIANSPQKSNQRKGFFLFSLFINIGMLFYFKYFYASYSALNGFFHFGPEISAIIFPAGISFYTFQSLSYLIDVYKNRIQPVNSYVQYVLYVCFFPQLVIGPIERGHHLMPQLVAMKKINSEEFEKGFNLILWGLLKKAAIGDYLSFLINPLFNNHNNDVFSLLLGSFIVTFKVYVDFSGYSDIARGLGFLFGVDLTRNFRPFYYAKNPAEFWQRWHISLTVWVREYLMPILKPKKYSRTKMMSAIFLSFIIIGVWHGAKINWLLFGAFHGIVMISYQLSKQSNLPINFKNTFWKVFMLLFYIVCGYLHQVDHVNQIFKASLSFNFQYIHEKTILSFLLMLSPVFLYEYFQESRLTETPLVRLPKLPRSLMYLLFLVVLFYLNRNSEAFVYYQF